MSNLTLYEQKQGGSVCFLKLWAQKEVTVKEGETIMCQALHNNHLHTFSYLAVNENYTSFIKG